MRVSGVFLQSCAKGKQTLQAEVGEALDLLSWRFGRVTLSVAPIQLSIALGEESSGLWLQSGYLLLWGRSHCVCGSNPVIYYPRGGVLEQEAQMKENL